MALYVPGGFVGQIIEGLNAITGSAFLSYFIIFIILVAVFTLLFKVPLTWVVIGCTGMVLTLLAYSNEWLVFFGVLAFMLAAIIARNWITG